MPDHFIENVVADENNLATLFRTLLKKLGLLDETQEHPTVLDESAVMKTVATNLGKWWAGIAGAAGGSLTVTSLIAAMTAAQEPTKVALIAAAGFALSATAIAIALIVRADLDARASVTRSLFQARQELTKAYMAASVPSVARPAQNGGLHASDLAGLLAGINVEVPGEAPSSGLTGLHYQPGQPPQVRRGDGRWVVVPAAFEIEAELPPQKED